MFKEEDYDVGGEIRERVYGVGYHGAASSQDSCGELECEQKEIGQRPDERDFDYFLFAFMTLLPLHRICCVFVV